MNDLIISKNLIESKIFLIRGEKVMLDSDLANLYGVETRVLNQAVKRNLDRFPGDFMFKLDKEELLKITADALRKFHQISLDNSESLNTLDKYLEKIEQHLELVKPENLLKKGYTLIYQDGKIVKHAASIREGQLLETKFMDGTVLSEVRQINLPPVQN